MEARHTQEQQQYIEHEIRRQQQDRHQQQQQQQKDQRQQQERKLLAQEARGVLGLPVTPSSTREKDLSASVTSADSADIAGGRGSRAVVRDSKMHGSVDSNSNSNSSGSSISRPPIEEIHLHPSRVLWEAHVAPSPSQYTQYPSDAFNSITPNSTTPSRRPIVSNGGGREGTWGRGGGGGGLPPPPPETAWSPVVRDTSGTTRTAIAHDSSSRSEARFWPPYSQEQSYQPPQRHYDPDGRLVVRGQPIYGPMSARNEYQHQRQQQSFFPRQSAVIDRPASRGQEYRREKKNRRTRSWRNSERSKNENGKEEDDLHFSSSSLMKSGSIEGQLQNDTPGVPATGSHDRRRFLGIRWPPLTIPGLSKPDNQRSDSDPFGSGAGGLDEEFSREAGTLGGGRLWVSMEGTTEIGKGLTGHAAYEIQVTDRAIGHEWTVFRRFRQFEELHADLLHVLSREPDANGYVLPPKEIFGGRHGGVIAKRLKLLKVYLDRLVLCRAALEHRAMASFLELDPALRGLGAYGRRHGPECVLKEGLLRVKEWKGPHKPVINILEAGLGLLGWVSAYAIVSPGPVFLTYRGPEDDPEKPLWTLPDRRTIGSQVRVRRVDMWRADLEKDKTRLFLVTWENTSLLCQVDSDEALESWAHALDDDVDLRPQQSEQDRAKVDVELKAKEEWSSREEGLWGGL